MLISNWGAPVAQAKSLCVNQGGTGGCFGTIGAAISAAADGDSIHIAGGGPYLERLAIDKGLSLIGDDSATTIIDGAQGGEGIRITSVVSVTLARLTIPNGLASPSNSDQSGSGVHSQLRALTQAHVIVSDTETGIGTI